MKATRAAVAVLSALLLLGPLALSARTAEIICPNVVDRGKSWSSIAAPAFTSGGRELTAYAVHPLVPTIILASNGEQIWQSQNSGCDWKPFFSIDLLPRLDAPVSTANSRIVSIDIPEAPAAAHKIYILVAEQVGPAVRPHVIITGGQDGRFRTTIDGLPPLTGGLYGLHVAPSDPDVVYLQVRETPATFKDDIYASFDGGDTWEKRSRNDSGAASQGMAVDPLAPDELWTFGANGLWRSLDAGASRTSIDQVGVPTPVVDVFHKPGSPARVMAYEAETFTFSVTRDGGATWSRINGPGGPAISIAHGADADDVVVSQNKRVDRFKPPEFWTTITPDYPQPNLMQLSSDRTADPSVFGLTPLTIERYTGLNDEIEIPGFNDLTPPEVLGDTSLQPAQTTLKLKAGKSEQVDYRFALPANPTPLDVFFLVDTSASMDPSIAGLRNGMQKIVDSLAASKIDVQFGVGEVKDYPIPGFGDPVQGDFPYRLNRAIGPADTSLSEALAKLESSGGGRGDYEESQLTGLYQAATGEGEPGCVASPREEAPPCVPPGQGAQFRADALPVIVHVTDYGFHDQAAHPSPPFAQVASTLRAKGIRQVGLAAEGTQGNSAAIVDLTDMAEQTEAIAPAGGVDCDGNGSIDIRAGAALVCAISDTESDGVLNLAPAIIATVRAIAEDVSVELVTSDKKGVVDVAPALYPTVDITERNSLGFDVAFTCPRSLAGTTHNLTLAAKVSGTPVASATAKVVCQKLPAAALLKQKPKQEPPPPPLPVVPVFPPAPVIVPAIAPAGPPPVPETITSTQSAAQAQGAVAKQEQQQVQFAVAYAQFRNDEAYALSSYSEDRRAASPVPLYLSAVVMTLAAGFFALSRSGARAAAAYRRR
ncbi:MAG: hypothetical protein M3N53_14770 [Actinomycetota bacterium]|nr:hypothetical protein [Actinomycetota bacterium]